MGGKLRIAVKALCEESDLIFQQETMLIDFDNAFSEGLSGDFVSFTVNATKADDGLLRGEREAERWVSYSL